MSMINNIMINNIKAFFLKVEGVLTDGRSIIKDNGNISIFLNEKDTFALRMARMKGYPIGIYSDELTNVNAMFFMRYGIEEKDLFVNPSMTDYPLSIYSHLKMALLLKMYFMQEATY